MRPNRIMLSSSAAPSAKTIAPKRRRPGVVTSSPWFIATAVLITLCASCSYVDWPYYRPGQSPADDIPDNEVDHRVFLIGDAGAPDPHGERNLQVLAYRVRQLPERSTVVFLGDNIYERGMPEIVDQPKEAVGEATQDAAHALIPGLFDSRKEAERQLDAQIDVVRGSPARAIFVPGNHDWDQFQEGGWGRIRAFGAYVDGIAAGGVNVTLQPKGGCPGPVSVPLGNRGTLIILDTQWWLELRPGGKPTPDKNPTECAYTTEEAVREALLHDLQAAAGEKRWAIVAGHHPLESNGPHGGFEDYRTHLFPFRMAAAYVPSFVNWFPLPILGSVAVGLRACCSPSTQDTANGVYRHMRLNLMQPMVEAKRHGYGPLLYAAGHDHSLQVFRSPRGPRFTVVSGLGSSTKVSSVGKTRRTLFAHANGDEPGFMVVELRRDGGVRLAVIERSKDIPDGQEVYSKLLIDGDKRPPERTVPRV